MVIQCQVEFITFNSNNNEYAYKINRSDIIFHVEKFYQVYKFYQFTNNVSSQLFIQDYYRKVLPNSIN